MAGSSNEFDVSAPTQDLKFMMVSNVNVSNFVSVKLCGRSNYDIWKAQMLCLIKSQVLLHIINAKHPFPKDKGVHMIPQYDKLVKGWIFGSVNEKVLGNLVKESLNSAEKVWMELESSFMPTISDTEGDSSNAHDVPALDDVIAPVVSAKSENLKYMLVSNVNISNFVSVKLSSRINYRIWKAQMICLMESHMLLHIVDAKFLFPGYKDINMIWQYDRLVKGWIFGTMSDHVLIHFVDFDSAREVWMELESRFGQPIRNAEGVSSNTLDVFARTEDMKYMLALNVNVSNFVTVELSGRRNYDVWKTQMLCLIESHDLLHIISNSSSAVRNPMNPKYVSLVKGWIFGTMNDQVLPRFLVRRMVEAPAFFLWRELESVFTKPDETSGDSWDVLDVYSPKQDLKYMQASNVNVSNFVSVKLSGHRNYKIWKAQMLCLMECQKLLYVIDDKNHLPIASLDKYNSLVKGWIFGTMNDELLKDFTHHPLAADVWKQLASTFDLDLRDEDDEGVTGFIFRTEFERLPEIEDMDNIILKKDLYEAAVEGCWWKTKSMLKVHKNAATKAITENGNTILHLAVEMSHNYFLEKLLEFLEDGKDIETPNSMGQTALHVAAIVGNNYAAELLVEKRKELLVIVDTDENSPLDYALSNRKLNIATFLLTSELSSDSSRYPLSHKEDMIKTVGAAIITKQYGEYLVLWVVIVSSGLSVSDRVFSNGIVLEIRFDSNRKFPIPFEFPNSNSILLTD